MTAKDLVQKHEGLELMPYKDSLGILTVGVGHNLEASPIQDWQYLADGSISMDTAMALFDNDFANATYPLAVYCSPWFQAMDPVRQAVIQDMCFNLGWPKLSQFHRTLGFFQANDWASASTAMLESLWAKQVPKRAEEDATMVSLGIWPDDPNWPKPEPEENTQEAC